MSFFSGIGRALKRVWKSPIGKVVTVAAAAYIGAPAVKSAFDAVSSGGGFGDAMSALGSKAWDQVGSIGDGAKSLFSGSGGGTVADSTNMEGVYSGMDGPTVDPVKSLARNGGAGGGGGSGGGIVSDAFKWMSSPGGAQITSAALKLAGGALTPNETAMRINYEEQKRQEELARQKANTAVSGLNFNALPLTRPQDRLPVPAAPVTVAPRHLG